MQDKRVLEIVSNETKEEVCNLDIVTPEIFAEVFRQKAREHDIEDMENSVERYLKEQVQSYMQLQNKTSKQANRLSETTSKAIEAIRERDDDRLEEVLHETQKLREEINLLRESLYKDELTGAYNRKWIHDNLLKEKSNQFARGGVMALIDLNYFKTINDTYGHIIGDKVLVFIATQLKKTKGRVVRYGGDEFLLFFQKGATPQSVRQILQSVREDLLKKHLKAKDAEFRVSFSIGVTPYEEDENLDEVIERADSDMYQDKQQIKKIVTGIEV